MSQSIPEMNPGQETVVRSLRQAGLSSRPVCVHASLRSFGHLEGGAAALVNGFLDEGCTVLVPSFTSGYLIPAPGGTNLLRNAPLRKDVAPHDRIFSPDTNEIDDDLGSVAAEVAGRPGRVRGHHPLGSFSAIGPMAAMLAGTQRPGDIYAPLAELARRDGAVVLIGVGLNRMTLLHLAERRAGRNLFRRWVNGPDGEHLLVEIGGCSEGFGNLDPQLLALRKEISVGPSPWQVYPVKATLNVATHAIRRDPRITHCGRECPRCDDAVAGGPVV